MTTQTESQPIHAHTAPTLAGVLAGAAGCALAGLGAGIVVGVGCVWLNASLTTAIGLSAATWGVISGLLLFWTFGHEPVSQEMLKWEIDRLTDEVEELTDQLKAAKKNEEKSTNEALAYRVQLNAKQNYVQPVSQSDPVLKDARAIGEYYFSTNLPPSRRKMEAQGMSQPRYQEAIKFLELHGAIAINGSQVTWIVQTREALEMALA